MRFLVGIDDTDNKESRGTGFKARQLAKVITSNAVGIVNGITRHQLYVHPDIAYTSQNSAACLDVLCDDPGHLQSLCADYLISEAADGSDAGLCIAEWDKLPETIIEWGEKARCTVLNLDGAIALANLESIYLEGFTGTKIGQIGALAAVGLRKSGNDGRFIWLHGTGELREFDTGIYEARELKIKSGIDLIQSLEEMEVPDNERIFCGGWTRPVLKNYRSVLLVEKVNFADYEWKTTGKEYIRAIS